MATITDIQPNEQTSLTEKAEKDLLPGTTIPDRLSPPTANSLPSDTTNGKPDNTNNTNLNNPLRVAGPTVNNRPTVLTLYSPPSQMQNAPCIPSMVKMINASFSAAHEQSVTFPGEVNRLSGEAQYLIELGQDPATFSYVLTYKHDSASQEGSNGTGIGGLNQEDGVTGDEEVVLATCAGMRFYGNATAMIKQPDGTERKSSFKRIGFPDPGTEVWEVRHLAVDVAAQKQGVAGKLIELVEEEAKRRFFAARKAEEERGRGGVVGEEGKVRVERLVMFLTTMKETNGRFYEKRGYKMDDEVRYEVGHMGTRSPFTVLHMSKTLV